MSMTEQEIKGVLDELRKEVRGSTVKGTLAMTPLQRAISDVNANWFINARLPAPDARAPFAWRLVYFIKSLVWRALSQALNSFTDQQNFFNQTVARALTELTKENSRLDARINELENQIKH